MELSNGRKNTSKVFYLNEKNKELLKEFDNVAYSEDKQYAIVYTKEDLNFIDKLLSYSEFNRYVKLGSNEDMLYNNILIETNIEPNVEEIFKMYVYDIQEDLFLQVKFPDLSESCKVSCIINKNDSVNSGSDCVYFFAEVNNKKVVIYEINEIQNEEVLDI